MRLTKLPFPLIFFVHEQFWCGRIDGNRRLRSLAMEVPKAEVNVESANRLLSTSQAQELKEALEAAAYAGYAEVAANPLTPEECKGTLEVLVCNAFVLDTHPGGSEACCSFDFKTCVDPSWDCGDSFDRCDRCDGKDFSDTGFYIWLQNGANTGTCRERYAACSDDKNSCCNGLECKDMTRFYSQCVHPDEPFEEWIVDYTGCCSFDFKNCMTWCGDNPDNCGKTCQMDNDSFHWLQTGPLDSCIPRWEDCTNNHDGCCPGLTCRSQGDWYQCLP